MAPRTCGTTATNIAHCDEKHPQSTAVSSLKLAAYTYTTGNKDSPLHGAFLPDCRHVGVDCFYYARIVARPERAGLTHALSLL